MKYKIKMMKYWSDWTDINELEIETKDYEKFEVRERLKNYQVLYGFRNGKWVDINEELNHNCLADPFTVKKDLTSK